ncbi:hypothetical protein NDU88_000681 [Pleurodeles waltl]|uniref:Uncharacterized protein n=1 Tax=Pleurodeles waltl TaxID=8319 RepID=A0AAV7LAX5_PLEWA|nr:hypothetical protein NDU88_000681 [Pleurodeles waltl]
MALPKQKCLSRQYMVLDKNDIPPELHDIDPKLWAHGPNDVGKMDIDPCLGRLLKPPPMPPVTLTNALIMRDVVTEQLMDIDISDNAPSSVSTVDYVNERNDAHYSNSRPIYEHMR